MYILFSANRYDNLNRSTTLTFASAWCGLFPLRHILQHVKLQHTNCSLFLAQYYYLSRQLIVTGKLFNTVGYSWHYVWIMFYWIIKVYIVMRCRLSTTDTKCKEIHKMLMINSLETIWRRLGRDLMVVGLMQSVPITTILNFRLPTKVLMSLCLFVVWWCLTSLSTIFQLYRGGKFYWWRKPRENHRSVASHWQTLSQNVVHLALI
jgi:hypothetical protein